MKKIKAHTDSTFFALRGLESLNTMGGDHDNIMVGKFKV